MTGPKKSISAIALLDALGFQGILDRAGPGPVIDALNTARTALASAREFEERGGMHGFQHWPVPPILHLGWFSDTMYVVAQAPDSLPPAFPTDSPELRAHLVDIVSLAVAFAVKSAAQAPFPIVFRGVITVGEVVVAPDSIYLGPAIDRAACLYEKAEGAFVWLSPEASALPIDKDRRQGPHVRYSVPLKRDTRLDLTNGKFDTFALNPFIHVIPRSNAGVPIRKGFEEAMTSTRSDVVVKRRHTLEFLDHIADTEPEFPSVSAFRR